MRPLGATKGLLAALSLAASAALAYLPTASPGQRRAWPNPGRSSWLAAARRRSREARFPSTLADAAANVGAWSAISGVPPERRWCSPARILGHPAPAGLSHLRPWPQQAPKCCTLKCDYASSRFSLESPQNADRREAMMKNMGVRLLTTRRTGITVCSPSSDRIGKCEKFGRKAKTGSPSPFWPRLQQIRHNRTKRYRCGVNDADRRRGQRTIAASASGKNGVVLCGVIADLRRSPGHDGYADCDDRKMVSTETTPTNTIPNSTLLSARSETYSMHSYMPNVWAIGRMPGSAVAGIVRTRVYFLCRSIWRD